MATRTPLFQFCSAVAASYTRLSELLTIVVQGAAEVAAEPFLLPAQRSGARFTEQDAETSTTLKLSPPTVQTFAHFAYVPNNIGIPDRGAQQ